MKRFPIDGPGTLTLAGANNLGMSMTTKENCGNDSHGIFTLDATDKPALALLRIHPGGAIRITGGGTMILFK